jgi:hypothetical protein
MNVGILRKKTNKAAALCCALAILAAGLAARADDVSDSARDLFKKNQHCVVTVQVVLKLTTPRGSQERRNELTGTVVDPSGLTVLALSSVDPTELTQRILPDEMSASQVETEVSDLKILQEDGTEIPAEIVLRDKDLDLAYVRPKAKLAAPMEAADLTKTATVQPLEQVLTINRLNRAAGRSYAASLERITAVLTKPRTFYIPDSSMTATGLGSPVFSLKGGMVGILVMRAISAKGASHPSASEFYTAVILPAEDILKGAKQAPEAKGDAEKPEAGKDSQGSSANAADAVRSETNAPGVK